MNTDPFDNRRLGDDGGAVRLDDLTQNRHAALRLIEQARHTVHIYTRDLDPPLYNAPTIEQALCALARRGRKSLVQIIVQDSSRAVRQGHRLITLAQRLSSYVQIRNPGRDYMDYNSAFLIADGVGLLRRPLADRYEGSVNFNDPLAARELLRYFREVWDHGRPDNQLRRLHI